MKNTPVTLYVKQNESYETQYDVWFTLLDSNTINLLLKSSPDGGKSEMTAVKDGDDISITKGELTVPLDSSLGEQLYPYVRQLFNEN